MCTDFPKIKLRSDFLDNTHSSTFFICFRIAISYTLKIHAYGFCYFYYYCKYSDDELPEYRASDVGFVFQFYNLIPTLTTLENVALIKEITKNSMDATKVLEAVGLKGIPVLLFFI